MDGFGAGDGGGGGVGFDGGGAGGGGEFGEGGFFEDGGGFGRDGVVGVLDGDGTAGADDHGLGGRGLGGGWGGGGGGDFDGIAGWGRGFAHADFDAAVGGLFVDGAAGDEGLEAAEAAGVDAAVVHGHGFDEVGFDGFGAFAGEVEVELVAADEVGMAFDPAVEAWVEVHEEAEFHESDFGAFAEFVAVELEEEIAGQHGGFADEDVFGEAEEFVEGGDAVECSFVDFAVGAGFEEVFGEFGEVEVVGLDGTGIDGDLADGGGGEVGFHAAEFGEVGVDFKAGCGFDGEGFGFAFLGGVCHADGEFGFDEFGEDVEFLVFGELFEDVDFLEEGGGFRGGDDDVLRGEGFELEGLGLDDLADFDGAGLGVFRGFDAEGDLDVVEGEEEDDVEEDGDDHGGGGPPAEMIGAGEAVGAVVAHVAPGVGVSHGVSIREGIVLAIMHAVW